MSAPPKSRVRSEAQLTQKRLVDRVKHRENRNTSKAQLVRIETEISKIQQSLESITEHLRKQTPSYNLAGPQTGVLNTAQGGQISVSVPSPVHQLSLGLHAHPPELAMPWAQQPPSLSLFRIPSCHCGTEHSDQFASLENCSITGLYRNQITFHQGGDGTTNLPRNPPLPSMMLHSEGDNFITSLMTPFLRSLKTNKTATMLGAYLFAYRLMRWQLEPGQSTLADVPNWLLPTLAQEMHHHPVCIDFLPWPGLREFLCSHPDDSSSQSIQFYWNSVMLNLPVGCEMFACDSEGKVSISPEFESAALDLRNWHMGSPWIDVFPHLVPLLA